MPPLADLSTLSLEQQVAQMIVVRASGHLFDHQIRHPAWEPPAHTLERWVRDVGVGGVILLGGSAAEIGLRTQQLQSWTSVPLLIAADIEEGVGQRFDGATAFPPPMAIAHIARHGCSSELEPLEQARRYAVEMGAATAQEALAMGLNWVLAPVVDVNNNAANPVINVRAFGDNPEVVATLATAFIEGTHQHPVLTAAKHFPGHGDTSVDSHLDLPVIPHDRHRLDSIEIPPFRAAIAAGVDAVMSAHLLIPTLDPQRPATLSPQVLNDLLRQDLGFEGLIVTDALVMGAIANHYGKNEAAVMAVEAGADILLMPLDPDGAIAAVVAAVNTGRLSPERIRASVERIRWAKKRMSAGLFGDTPADSSSHAWEQVSPPPIRLHQIAQPKTMAIAQDILRDSMVCLGNAPIPAVNSGRNVILLDDSLNSDFLGHHTPAIARPLSYGYHTLNLIDCATPQKPNIAVPDTIEPTLLQIFVRGNPFRGRVGLSGTLSLWLESLLGSSNLQGLIIYGSPYMLEYLRPKLSQSLPVIFTYGQMPAAQDLAHQYLLGPGA